MKKYPNNRLIISPGYPKNTQCIFYGEPKMVSITSSTRMVDMPDVGVSLSIQQQPHNAAVKVLVHPCVTGPFVLPPDYKAVSPVYLIQQVTTDQMLQKGLTVSIQHCANLKNKEDCNHMTFLLAQTEGKYYSFNTISGTTGKFRSGDIIGKITLNECGFLVVAIKGIYIYMVAMRVYPNY